MTNQKFCSKTLCTWLCCWTGKQLTWVAGASCWRAAI